MAGDKKPNKTEINQLISKGRKQGFLLFEEIDKTFQEDKDTGTEFDDFLSSMDDYGIKSWIETEVAPPKERRAISFLSKDWKEQQIR